MTPELREEDDRQEEAEVGEDKHLCSIFNLHAGKCPDKVQQLEPRLAKMTPLCYMMHDDDQEKGVEGCC